VEVLAVAQAARVDPEAVAAVEEAAPERVSQVAVLAVGAVSEVAARLVHLEALSGPVAIRANG
jgi:hypothetical protein